MQQLDDLEGNRTVSQREIGLLPAFHLIWSESEWEKLDDGLSS